MPQCPVVVRTTVFAEASLL